MHRPKNHTPSGFSLIEVIVALIIIGMVITAVIYKDEKIIDDSTDASKIAMQAHLQSSLALYLIENKSVPTVVQLAQQAIQTNPDHGNLVAHLDGNKIIYPTYSDTLCSSDHQNQQNTELVLCIGQSQTSA